MRCFDEPDRDQYDHCQRYETTERWRGLGGCWGDGVTSGQRRAGNCPMKPGSLVALLCLFCLYWIVPQAHAGLSYDAASDFSPTNNPNGVWSYGNSATLGGAFNPFTMTSNYQGIDFWNFGGGAFAPPLVGHNSTSSPITFSSVTVQAGELFFHPWSGSNDQFSIVQFTVPTAGLYSISTSFVGIDFVGPTTTDVHVLVDGSSIFDGAVNSYGGGPSFSTSLTLFAGDTIDFAVGRGVDGTYNFDSTGLSADISSATVPEPATLSLFGLGAIGLFWQRRRQRKVRGESNTSINRQP